MWRWEQIASVLRCPTFGVELGVKEGRFTEYLLRKFPELHMVAVDTWAPKSGVDGGGFETYATWDFGKIMAEFHAKTQPYADRLTVCRKDTREAAADFQDGAFDFVFIDAEHTYEGVKADIAAWRHKLKCGGLLSGHDYGSAFPGVIRAVNEFGNAELGSDKVWMLRVE